MKSTTHPESLERNAWFHRAQLGAEDGGGGFQLSAGARESREAVGDGPAQEEDWETQTPGWESLTETVVNKAPMLESGLLWLDCLGLEFLFLCLTPPTLPSHSLTAFHIL